MTALPRLRDVVTILATGLAALGVAYSQPIRVEKKTYTYKTVGQIEIKADVYRPKNDVTRPVILWIHGGALIMGSRTGIRSDLADVFLEAGYAIVSIDYRLAPATKLPAIYEDIKDAYAWLRKEGPRLFHIDPANVVVMGGSAGGFLTLSAGFLFEPRPRALVSFYGYGDVASAWYSRPDPFYLQRPRVSKEEAYKAVNHGELTSSAGKPGRGKFYLYCRQNGLWPEEVTGHDPDENPKAFDAFCPIRNVGKDYPPTILVHGDKDTDVPFEQSVLMDKELQRVGIKHEFIKLRGAGHGFPELSREEKREIYRRVRDLLDSYRLKSG